MSKKLELIALVFTVAVLATGKIKCKSGWASLDTFNEVLSLLIDFESKICSA